MISINVLIITLGVLAITPLIYAIFSNIKDEYLRRKFIKEKHELMYQILCYFLSKMYKIPFDKTETESSGIGEIDGYHPQPKQVAITSTIEDMEVTVTFWHMEPTDAEMPLDELIEHAAILYANDEIELGLSIIVKDTSLDLYEQEDELALKFLNALTDFGTHYKETFDELVQKEINKMNEENLRLDTNSDKFIEKVQKLYK